MMAEGLRQRIGYLSLPTGGPDTRRVRRVRKRRHERPRFAMSPWSLVTIYSPRRQIARAIHRVLTM